MIDLLEYRDFRNIEMNALNQYGLYLDFPRTSPSRWAEDGRLSVTAKTFSKASTHISNRKEPA